MSPVLASWLESEPATRLGWTLLHFVWQGAVIGMAYGLVRCLMFRCSASMRYLLACVAMLSCLTAPVVTWVWIRPAAVMLLSVPVDPVDAPVHSGSAQATAMKDHLAAVAAAPSSSAPFSAAVSSRAALPSEVLWSQRLEAALPWCVLGWLMGTAVLTLRLCFGWVAVQRWHRRGVPVTDSSWQGRLVLLARRLRLTGTVRLLTSDSVDSPMTIGWWKPVVLVPLAILSQVPAEQVEMILAHELAHIRRRDYLVHVVQCCIETVLFFHPAVWWIGRDLRRLREDCCDDLAASCGSPALLAKALLSLEEARSALPALALSVRGTGIVQRVRRLLIPSDPRHRPPPGWLAGAGAIVAGISLALTAHQLLAADIITVKPGESVQAAIDKATDGALIRLEAGLYPERITIRKSITLEGAGWDKTVLKPDKPEPGITPESSAAAWKRYQEAKDEAERMKLGLEYSDVYQRPTVLVDKAKGVVVRGLKIQGMPAEYSGVNSGEFLAKVRQAEATLTGCALIGPFGGGIAAMDGAQLTMRKTLVAGLWETGVAITAGGLGKGVPPTVTLSDCDVRNCYHRCITIGPGCNDVRIERSRISGSAWHGIRYDDASPRIENNLIFANARSGIYASGDTKASVRGNVIFGNEMDAVSCWFANKDEFRGNTFAANLREGVCVLGASHPTFTSNIFALNPKGLIFSMINGKSAAEQTLGQADLESNLFWQNETAMSAGEDKKSLAGTNKEEDPQFVNAAQKNFALQAGSAARKTGIGASDPIPFASPWPLQPEERKIIPAAETRDYSQWQKPGKAVSSSVIHQGQAQQARANSDRWVKDALQIDDVKRRQEALEAVRHALGAGGNMQKTFDGAVAFNRLALMEFDKASFRPLLIPLLDSPNPYLVVEACRALRTAGLEKADLDRFLKLASRRPDPVVQQNIIPLLLSSSTGAALEPSIEKAVLRALEPAVIDQQRTPSTEDTFRQSMRTLGERDLPPAVKARIIALCSDSGAGIQRLAFHFGLAPQPHKTAADIAALAKFVAHEDTGMAQRALWALSVGVDPPQRAQAAALLIKFIELRSDPPMRLQAWKSLLKTADKSSLSFCESQLRKPGLSAEEKKLITELVAQLKAAG